MDTIWHIERRVDPGLGEHQDQPDNGDERFYNRILALEYTIKQKIKEFSAKRSELERDRQRAGKQLKKYRNQKIWLTSINSVILTSSVGAMLIPGLGWLVSGTCMIISSTVAGGQIYCEKTNKKFVDQLVKDIDEKSSDCRSTADAISERWAQFERKRQQLIDRGIDKQQAEVTVMMEMIEGTFQSFFQLFTETQQDLDLGVDAWSVPVWMTPWFNMTGQSILVESLTKLAPTIEVSTDFYKFMSAALVGVTIAVTICDTIIKCSKASEAVVRCNEICELLFSGQEALQTFAEIVALIKDKARMEMEKRHRAETYRRIDQIDERVRRLCTRFDAQTEAINGMREHCLSQDEMMRQFLDTLRIFAGHLQDRRLAPEVMRELSSAIDDDENNK